VSSASQVIKIITLLAYANTVPTWAIFTNLHTFFFFNDSNRLQGRQLWFTLVNYQPFPSYDGSLMISGTYKPCTLCTVAKKCHSYNCLKSLGFSVLGDKSCHSRQPQNRVLCNLLKSLCFISPWNHWAFHLYKSLQSFFLNDFNDLRKLAPRLAYILQYIGVACDGSPVAASLTTWSPCVFAGLRG